MTKTMHAQSAVGGVDPWSLPLETLDVSDAEIFEHNRHGEYFRRLRQEDPVHWSPTGPTGPYWSITKFNDIVAIDANHKVFSSDRNIVIGDQPDDFSPTSFIAADPPKHDFQRRAANPAVAPARLSDLESLIRERVGTVLDGLPVGEEFN